MIEQTVDNALTGNEAAAAALEMMRATREKLRAEALAREEEQFIADERRRAALEAGDKPKADEDYRPGDIAIDEDEESPALLGKDIVKGSESCVNAFRLATLGFPEPKPIVQQLIVPGVTLLVGASKIGKSWLTLDMCLSIATGAPFLGRKTQRCRVWYMALEDSPSRMKSRLMRITDGAVSYDAFNLTFIFDSPTVDMGFTKRLTRSFDKNIAEGKREANPEVIVIDTLQVIRGMAGAASNAYAADYSFIRSMKAVAEKYGVAIVLVHHTNKLRQTDDPYEKVSGSTGLMGAADTTLLLERARGSDEATLSGVSRDVYFEDIPLRFDKGLWRVSEPRAALNAYDAIDSPLSLTLCELFTSADCKDTFVSYADCINLIRENGGMPPATGRELARQIESLMQKHPTELGFRVQTGMRATSGVRGINIVPV